MKTALVHLRLEDDEIASLDKMAGRALNRQAVARMLLIAAIEAVQRNGGRIALPPRFEIAPETTIPKIEMERTSYLNEPHKKR
jgi:hypothetical protein